MRVLLGTAALITGVVALALERERHAQPLQRRIGHDWLAAPDAPAQLHECGLHDTAFRHMGELHG
jgi:hypothetical protein